MPLSSLCRLFNQITCPESSTLLINQHLNCLANSNSTMGHKYVNLPQNIPYGLKHQISKHLFPSQFQNPLHIYLILQTVIVLTKSCIPLLTCLDLKQTLIRLINITLNTLSMMSLSDTGLRRLLDPSKQDSILSPQRECTSRKAILDCLYPNNLDNPADLYGIAAQPQKDKIGFDRAARTPQDKGRGSAGSSCQRPQSKQVDSRPCSKTEKRIEIKNSTGKTTSVMRYEFKATNLQFSKKPLSKHSRKNSNRHKDLKSEDGKQNQYLPLGDDRQSTSKPSLVNQYSTYSLHRLSHPCLPQYTTKPFTLPFELTDQPQSKETSFGKRISPLSQIPIMTNSIFVLTPQKGQQQEKMSLAQFIKGKRLGKGHFGQVFVVKHKESGFVCAMKVVPKSRIIEEKVGEQIIRQLKIHSCMKHPNIIQQYGFFADEINLYILQELCTDGQLWDLLKKKIRVNEKYAAYLIRQVIEGLRYLHSNMIYHRDIKPQNILMENGIVKIGDFGWAVHCIGMRNTRCGTPLYLSPEIVRGDAYDERVDVWGVGVMTYELIIGSIPFKIYCEDDVKKIATQAVRFPDYVDVSEKAKDFILKALNKDPRQRVGLLDLYFHPFLKQTHQMMFIPQGEQKNE